MEFMVENDELMNFLVYMHQLTVRDRESPLTLVATIREQHRQRKMFFNSLEESEYSIANFNFMIYSSKKPFQSLKRIRIPELPSNVPAADKYLILRTIEEGYVRDSWNTVVEDHAGYACNFRLFCYSLEEQFVVGTVFILKEPYYGDAYGGMKAILCHCPTDIIVLNQSSPMYGMAKKIRWKNKINGFVDLLRSRPVPKTPKMWKERGNALYKSEQYVLAGEAYALGLKECGDLNDCISKALQLNLSAVWLVLGYYEKTIVTAQKVLEKYPHDLKGLLRVGKSHYHLRQYNEALISFQLAFQSHGDNAEAKKELEKTKRRIKEQTQEHVDLGSLLANCNQLSYKFTSADYMGPVKLIDIPGKDRGVVVTKDVAAGTVLMISKAIAVTYDLDDLCGFPSAFESNIKLRLAAEVSQLVAKNPNTFGPIIYELPTGVTPREEIQLFCDPLTKSEPISDVAKIKTICDRNAILFDYSDEIVGVGLFVMPSYINSNSVANADIKGYCDTVFVHSIKPIKEGEEVFLGRNFEERKCVYLFTE